MDARARTRKSQTWKRSKRQARRDRISSLPDSILHRILSFLPTKCAVRTSILSTRWKYLWTSVAILDFKDYSHPKAATRFMDFVDRLLFLHDLPNIHKFSLACSGECDASRMNAWVSAVVKRNVEELNLDIMVHELDSRCLFTCGSLRVLKLKLLKFGSDLKIPSSICFSSLKILHLSYITFSDEYLTRQLFCGIPVLEDLIVEDCEWLDIEIFSISAPALKRLRICCMSDFYNGLNECEIKIYAPSLISLDYKGCLSYDYDVSNLTSLIDASIDVSTRTYGEKIGCPAIKLLRGLSNVNSLSISSSTTQVLYEGEESLYLFTHLPMFHNLIRLELRTTRNEQFDGITLNALLQRSPNLESLVFSQAFQQYHEDPWVKLSGAQNFLSHLKVVKFCSLWGDDDELFLIRFLLKNATALEKMTLVSSKYLSADLGVQMLVAKHLLLLPKASTRGVIAFS